jgi:hypothetical protein
MRQNEPWAVVIDTGRYSPWLGDSFENFARTGLSFQRSQNGGRLVRIPGPVISYYQRTWTRARSPAAARTGSSRVSTRPSPGSSAPWAARNSAGASALLQPVDAAVQEALRTFDGRDPSAIVPVLARGLAAARVAHRGLSADVDATLILERKIEQFQTAINTALGLELIAEAQPTSPTGSAASVSPFAPPPVMGPVVPGQEFEVHVALARGSAASIEEATVSLRLDEGWRVESEQNILPNLSGTSPSNQYPPNWSVFTVRVPADAPISTRPYFSRASIQEARYQVADQAQFGLPFTGAPPTAVVRYRVGDVPVEARAVVKRREAKLPYGYVMRELRVVPAVSLTVSPATAVMPLAAATRRVDLTVDVLNSRETGSKGVLALRVPPGWEAEPAEAPLAFTRAGERASFRFTVSMPPIENRRYEVRAVATVDDREYSEGFEEIDFRDLEARHLYRPSTIAVRGIDVATVPGLKVGYVMGIGDQVPPGIRQLGYEVTLLDEWALATADLSQYDAIMTGTRAYAVREDLKTYNQRLLDYARNGGHLIVLYNTQELVPNQFAPFPGELTARAEEVSEEDSPVQILAPDAPMLNVPNKITQADFDGWVEQRGSKFWSTWDPAYTPIIATHDIGQVPQRGGWLWAKVGKGNYTYFAYAFHRQLPYGVPGAYRLLANLLALGRSGQ